VTASRIDFDHEKEGMRPIRGAGADDSARKWAKEHGPKGVDMRRFSVIFLTGLLAVALTATAAQAASPHLKGRNPVSFTDNILTLSATVSYAGLGNFDTLQTLSASANPTAECVNPGTGEHRPAGQNPASVNVTGSTAVPAGDIKNGNVTIATTTDPPTTPVAGAPDCPNSNWTENITDMAFTSATIRLFQDSNANGTFESGELVLTVNCTFSPPTSNGPVPSSGFTCTTA
jgi:hypothetical protein